MTCDESEDCQCRCVRDEVYGPTGELLGQRIVRYDVGSGSNEEVVVDTITSSASDGRVGILVFSAVSLAATMLW